MEPTYNHSVENEPLQVVVSILSASEENSTNVTSQNVLGEYDFYFNKWFYKTFVPILYACIALIGGTGNGLVVIVILAKAKMRTRMNILLLNLALADILFLVICVPVGAYRYAADTWNIGQTPCKLLEYLTYVTMYVTMYTLVLISVVRYLIVACSAQSARYLTKWKICIMITCIWVINLVGNSHIYTNYIVKTFVVNGSQPYRYCAIRSVDTGKLQFITFFVFSYVLPLCLISIFYLLLLRHIRVIREASSLRHLRDKSQAENRHYRHTRSASKILLRVVVILAISWLPLHLHFMLAYFGYQPRSRAYEIYRVLCFCLAYSNSCMNPFIYSFVSSDFRSSFRSILCACCKGPQKNTESDGPQTVPLDMMNE